MNTIFLVEDSRSQRQLMKTLLMAERFTVHTATNGLEAIEKIQRCDPDVVILDIVMPQLNGYETCRRLKKNPRTQNIPVIFCSSQNGQSDIYWGLKQGAAAYITKPFRPKELAHVIYGVLNGVRC